MMLVIPPSGDVAQKCILPNQWQGQIDCLVGPFSSHDVAAYFTHYGSEFGQYETISFEIFARRDAWYIEIITMNN